MPYVTKIIFQYFYSVFLYQGKTDVAMLTILRVISMHMKGGITSIGPAAIQKDDFKIIYVCVMF